MTAVSLLATVSALVGLALAPSPGFATVPLGLQFLATMLFTFPASLCMQRVGRRAGFMGGAAFGLLGAALAAWSVAEGSFEGLCAGAFCIGIFIAFAQYYRFAAADVATAKYRSRAISLVLAGGVVAAFAGPNLANASRDLFATAVFAGCFVVVAGLAAGTMLVLAFVRVPHYRSRSGNGVSRPLAAIAMQPRYLTAVAGALVGYAAMNLLMTSTPLAMETRTLPFAATASVIQWHVVGMFAPSFFTGHLIRRFGTLQIMLVGAVLQAACVAVNLAGDSYAHFLAALVLLGLGWNFLFIGATHPAHRDLYLAGEGEGARLQRTAGVRHRDVHRDCVRVPALRTRVAQPEYRRHPLPRRRGGCHRMAETGGCGSCRPQASGARLTPGRAGSAPDFG